MCPCLYTTSNIWFSELRLRRKNTFIGGNFMDNKDKQKICINCVKDLYIKRYIKENGIKSRCSICGNIEIACEVLEQIGRAHV